MGVQRLSSFAKSYANIYHSINILDEIKKCVTITNRNAVIIFDVMGFIHIFGKTAIELSLGGRYHIYLRIFEEFICKLIRAGASLAFFCDGQLQSERNDVWCNRRDAEFRASLQLVSDMNDQCSSYKRRFGCKTIVKSLFKLIEDKNYGEIIISTQVDCDAAIAKYAAKNHALAVIASDSDFLIFEGDFQWWEVDSLRMQQMQVNAFDRKQFIRMMNLTYDEMKYFATIGGNDYTKHLIKKPRDFHEIAQFCRSLHEDDVLHKIIKYMVTSEIKQQHIDCVITSIKSYDINFDEPIQKFNRLEKYCASNVLLYAFWEGKVFQYEVNFLDFNQRNQSIRNNNENYSIFDTLLLVFRKLAGILLKCTAHKDTVIQIVTKYARFESYTLKQHTPIYPSGFLDIEELLFDECYGNDEIKWNLLLWSLGLNPQIQFALKNLPKHYVMTVLALIFLYQAGEISTMAADALLLSQHNILELKFNLDVVLCVESNVNKESIRTGQLFNRTITLLWDCLTVCGLRTFIQLDWYDGPYFNGLFTQFQQMNASKYNKCIDPIRKYRLYATLGPANGIFQLQIDE